MNSRFWLGLVGGVIASAVVIIWLGLLPLGAVMFFLLDHPIVAVVPAVIGLGISLWRHRWRYFVFGVSCSLALLFCRLWLAAIVADAIRGLL